MALPTLGSVGRFSKAAAGAVGAGALRIAKNTALAGAGAVLSQSPMTAMLLGVLGSGVSRGREVFQQLSERMEGVEESSAKTEKNTEEIVKEAKKENSLTRKGHTLFRKMIENLAGIRNVLVNQFIRDRRSNVIASMRKFQTPIMGPFSQLQPQGKEGGMGFLGTLGTMLLARKIFSMIGTGLLSAVGAAMAGGALLKGLGKMVWTVGKKGVKFAGPVGLIIGIVFSIFDGIVDGFEEYRKSGSLSEALIKGISSFFSDLTFGIISKEQVEGIIRPIVNGIGSALKWVVDSVQSIGKNLEEAVNTVKGWYTNLVNNIPTWDDLVKLFPERVQKLFKTEDPNAPPVNPGKPNSKSVVGLMTTEEQDSYVFSLRNRLRILKKEKEQLGEQIEAQRNIAKDSAKISQLAGVPRLYSSGILQAIESPERASAVNKDMAATMKYAFSLMSNNGLLTAKNPVHRNMESLFAYNNKTMFSGKSQKEKQEIVESMIKEFSDLFSKNKGNLAQIELESRAELNKRLKEVSKGQEETEKTIREMLSNSPPFLMTIRDAILGKPNVPSLYSRMVELLKKIYDAIVGSIFPQQQQRNAPGVPPQRARGASTGSSGSPSGTKMSPEQFGTGPKGLLDYVGTLESRGNYNALTYGKGTPKENPNLTKMTISEVMDYQKGMKARGHASSAVGKYQIVRSTLAEATAKAGFDPKTTVFSPEVQDKLATVLMERRGLSKFLSGKITADQFANNMSKEWAALPFSTGKSYYQGDAVGNRALDTRSNFMQQIRKSAIMEQPKTTIGGLPDPNPPGSALVDQNRRLEALSKSVRPGSAPEVPPPTQPPVVMDPIVVTPQASSGRPKNVSGFSTMPVRNSEWDFRKWNTDSMLRAMA